MSDYLFAQYKKRDGELLKEEFDERQEILKADLRWILMNSGFTIGEFSAACAFILTESGMTHANDIAYVFSMAAEFAENMRGVALEQTKGGNA